MSVNIQSTITSNVTNELLTLSTLKLVMLWTLIALIYLLLLHYIVNCCTINSTLTDIWNSYISSWRTFIFIRLPFNSYEINCHQINSHEITELCSEAILAAFGKQSCQKWLLCPARFAIFGDLYTLSDFSFHIWQPQKFARISKTSIPTNLPLLGTSAIALKWQLWFPIYSMEIISKDSVWTWTFFDNFVCSNILPNLA